MYFCLSATASLRTGGAFTHWGCLDLLLHPDVKAKEILKGAGPMVWFFIVGPAPLKISMAFT